RREDLPRRPARLGIPDRLSLPDREREQRCAGLLREGDAPQRPSSHVWRAVHLEAPSLEVLSVVTRRLLRRVLVATLATACLPAPAVAQGGPPLITDDPDTPGPGHWEINIAALMAKTRAQRRVEVPRVD